MELLASCNLERSKTFNGKLSIEGENGKEIKVSLNLVVGSESEEEVFASVKGTEKCITFAGDVKATKCPMGYEGKVFNEYGLDDVLNDGVPEVSGVITLVRLTDDYSNMQVLRELCLSRPDVRVIGGKLLNIEGVRIGRFDSSKPVVCSGVYDTFIESDIDDLEGIKEKIKKVKVAETKEKKIREKSAKAPTEKKVSKKVTAFNNMFGGGGEAF